MAVRRFTMTRCIALCAALILMPALAEAKDFKPANNAIDFDTPGMNICCSLVEKAGYYPDPGEGPQLSCTRVAPDYWIVHLRPDGTVRLNKDPGEVPGCGYGAPLGNVLNYGDNWQSGAFSCKMGRDGLICKAKGKGFKLSRRGLRQYR
jgi:hypothetical protein